MKLQKAMTLTYTPDLSKNKEKPVQIPDQPKNNLFAEMFISPTIRKVPSPVYSQIRKKLTQRKNS